MKGEIMKLNYENVMREYADHFGKELSPECHQAYSTIAQSFFGHWNDDFLINKNEICAKMKISTRKLVSALRDLAAVQLVFIHASVGGRGKKTGYALNLETMQKLHGLETVQNKQCKINSVKIGTIHGFSNPIDFKSPPVVKSTEPAQPVAVATPPHIKGLPQHLIEMCDKLNRIPRTSQTFAREMRSSKEVVNSVVDIVSHNGSTDYDGALGWIVKMAQAMKEKGHWYLKAKSIRPSTLHYCLDEIITEIETEKKRREKSKESDDEYSALTRRETAV